MEGKANLIELQGILDAIDRKIEKSDFEEKIMMVVSKKNNEIVKMLEELKNESIRESFYDS